MSETTAIATAAVAAYLIGAIPFGFLIAKQVRGIDIRDHGSGNIGATNVFREVGRKWGILVLSLDLLKGLLPVWLLPMWLLDPESASLILIHVRVLTGIMAVTGHMLPCYLRFRGGKGVATALGVVIILGGWGTPVALLLFVITLVAWRLVALSSIIAVSGFAVTQLIVLYPYELRTSSLLAFSIAVPALIVFRHRSNIARLLRGEEERTSFGAVQELSESE